MLSQSLKSVFYAASFFVICVFSAAFARDLALGKPAAASREEPGFTADKAFTTSTSNDSRWSSYSASGDNDNQWIAVDLGEVYEINRVVLNWEAAFGKDYRIEVSLNGTSWTLALLISNNPSAGRVEHTFPPVNAKHVRMFGIERGFEHGGFSLFQFEVYSASVVTITVSDFVRLNSVGFLPNYPKKATVRGNATGFTVVNSVNNDIVHTGTLGAQSRSTDTNEDLRIADFSGVNISGRYHVNVPGIGRSADFYIGDSVFIDPYRTMMLGFYLWRCGTAVNATLSGSAYQYAACHLNDGNTQHIGGGTKDGTGGWHDAGDYNKYMTNSSTAVAMMLKAWEHFGDVLMNDNVTQRWGNYASNIPAFLAEVKWNLDWVAKMQYGNGRVAHKLSAETFDWGGAWDQYPMPNEDNIVTRYFVPGGTEAAGSFAGQLAQASRIYAPYDAVTAAQWLELARVSYEWLASNPNFVPSTQDALGFSTGRYTTHDDPYSIKKDYDRDKRLWAAIELWETTGEQRFLQDFENLARVNEFGSEIDWGERGGMNGVAYITYLTSERDGRRQSLFDSLKTRLFVLADALADSSARHAYGRTFGSSTYYWGIHGSLTATTYILNAASMFAENITTRKKYRDAGHEVIGHIFGRNFYNRSFVTEVGHNPPQNLHDRRSMSQSRPWPGYLIGGPHSISDSRHNNLCSTPHATCWKDDADDYWTNEIAINWNASMIYALAGFLPGAQPPIRYVSVRHASTVKKSTLKIFTVTGRNVKIDLPFAADSHTEIAIYNMQGRKLLKHTMPENSWNAAIKIPANIARGTYILNVKDAAKKNMASAKITLR